MTKPAIWTSVLKFISFKYPPTVTKGSKNNWRPASIPALLKSNVEPIAPADNITISEKIDSSISFFIYFIPLTFESSTITSVTSASLINVAPSLTASSIKSFPDHFASAGHPNAHLPHWIQSSSRIAFGILSVFNPSSLPASKNNWVPLPICESSKSCTPTSSSTYSYSLEISIPYSCNSSSNALTILDIETIVAPPTHVVVNKSTSSLYTS